MLVDRGYGADPKADVDDVEEDERRQSVCVVFFRGPDDRESLELVGRMAEHSTVKVDQTGIRSCHPEKSRENNYSFSIAAMNHGAEKVHKELHCNPHLKLGSRHTFAYICTCDLDNATMTEFRRRWEGTTEYTEWVVGSVVEDVLNLGKSGGYDLIVVGKGRFPSTAMVAGLVDLHAEHTELSPVGDILASSTNGVASSVLVVQQYNSTRRRGAILKS
ncbi:LOW QUALITY PROTEIN: hypothetical protein V2J09_012030 [Rumex salicifolius]